MRRRGRVAYILMACLLALVLLALIPWMPAPAPAPSLAPSATPAMTAAPAITAPPLATVNPSPQPAAPARR